MVTEFYPAGNQRKFLIKSRIRGNTVATDYVNVTSTLSHGHLLKLAADVASGMVHLSSQNVIEFIRRDFFHLMELFHFPFTTAWIEPSKIISYQIGEILIRQTLIRISFLVCSSGFSGKKHSSWWRQCGKNLWFWFGQRCWKCWRIYTKYVGNLPGSIPLARTWWIIYLNEFIKLSLLNYPSSQSICNLVNDSFFRIYFPWNGCPRKVYLMESSQLLAMSKFVFDKISRCREFSNWLLFQIVFNLGESRFLFLSEKKCKQHGTADGVNRHICID